MKFKVHYILQERRLVWARWKVIRVEGKLFHNESATRNFLHFSFDLKNLIHSLPLITPAKLINVSAKMKEIIKRNRRKSTLNFPQIINWEWTKKLLKFSLIFQHLKIIFHGKFSVHFWDFFPSFCWRNETLMLEKGGIF